MKEEQQFSADLLQKLSVLPEQPGVYLMRDAAGVVIYVGKARSLKNRVKTYFGVGDGRLQLPALMERVRDLETIVTLSEQQAFVLERDLITKYKPRYNIKLKDDKAFLSIRVDPDAKWPRVELVRRVQDDGARYFGPYSFSHELRTLLEIIRRSVPLRSCQDTVFFNRTRPCLEYQIKRCCGPCCLPVEESEYRGYVKQAIALLEGKTDQIRRELQQKMEQAAEDLRFEDAATWRDRLDVLENLKDSQRIMSHNGEARDVFAFFREERLAVVVVLKVRSGRVSETKNFALQDLEVEDSELLEGVITQFYEGSSELPDEVVLPIELANGEMIADQLTEQAERKVEVNVPQRGSKIHLLQMAQLNAKQQFVNSFDAEARYIEIAKSAALTFALRQLPRRIECVDISNLQGSDIVGALVSFFDGSPDKNHYRKYKISQQGKPDDFASIHEVVERRLRSAIEHEDLPDLLVIDGGPQQLAEAHRARDDLGVTLDIISLAKERVFSDHQSSVLESVFERVYLNPDAAPINLTPGSELTRFMQRLRDETHRFVITFHRTSRNKRVFRSAIDDIPGVGVQRRARLLHHFGSVAILAKAPVEEVAKVGRMPLPLAERILSEVKKGLKN